MTTLRRAYRKRYVLLILFRVERTVSNKRKRVCMEMTISYRRDIVQDRIITIYFQFLGIILPNQQEFLAQIEHLIQWEEWISLVVYPARN